jgi:hypothetical protein
MNRAVTADSHVIPFLSLHVFVSSSDTWEAGCGYNKPTTPMFAVPATPPAVLNRGVGDVRCALYIFWRGHRSERKENMLMYYDA